jgi:hypothetical protein
VKYINNSEQSLVRRTYACDECDIEWTQWVERDAPIPECPQCELNARNAVGAPPVLTTKSQAMDITYKAMEDMGYTNMADNQRQGDTAVVPPSAPTAEEVHVMTKEALEVQEAMGITRLSDAPQAGPGTMSQAEMGKNFWMGAGGKPMSSQDSAQMIAGAGAGAAIARKEGRDPIAMIHEQKRPIDIMVEASDTGRRGPMVIR